MADQTTNATLLYKTPVSAGPEACALFEVKSVTTSDTVNLATWFTKVKGVAAFGAGSVTTVSTSQATLVITITQASLASDTIYLLAVGDAV